MIRNIIRAIVCEHYFDVPKVDELEFKRFSELTYTTRIIEHGKWRIAYSKNVIYYEDIK